MKESIEALILANQMIESIKETDFLQTNVFVGENELREKLVKRISEKAEEFGEYRLSQEEFVSVVEEVHLEAINKTLIDLVEKGAVRMSVSENGEILYSRDKDFLI